MDKVLDDGGQSAPMFRVNLCIGLWAQWQRTDALPLWFTIGNGVNALYRSWKQSKGTEHPGDGIAVAVHLVDIVALGTGYSMVVIFFSEAVSVAFAVDFILGVQHQ